MSIYNESLYGKIAIKETIIIIDADNLWESMNATNFHQ